MTARAKVLTPGRVRLLCGLAVALMPVLFGWGFLGEGAGSGVADALEVMLTASTVLLVILTVVSAVRDFRIEAKDGVRVELHVALLALVAAPIAQWMISILRGVPEDPSSAQLAFMVIATSYALYAGFATATSLLWGTRRWRVMLFHLGGFTMPVLSAITFLLTTEWELAA